MSSRAPLSVAVITLDAERDLERCLRSVDWAEERLVVDCGSTDGTLALATRLGATVHHQAWLGFAAQRNRALELARHEWVLTLDADEWLDAAAGNELRNALEACDAAGYELRRVSLFGGAFVRRAYGPDWQLRLFRRGRGRYIGDGVHERVELAPGSRVRRLGGALLHAAYGSIGEHLRKLDRYTDLAAAALHARGKRFSAWRLALSPPAAFLKVLVLRGGFLDGVRGWLVAGGAAHYALAKYGKLWELERAAKGETAPPPQP